MRHVERPGELEMDDRAQEKANEPIDSMDEDQVVDQALRKRARSSSPIEFQATLDEDTERSDWEHHHGSKKMKSYASPPKQAPLIVSMSNRSKSYQGSSTSGSQPDMLTQAARTLPKPRQVHSKKRNEQSQDRLQGSSTAGSQPDTLTQASTEECISTRSCGVTFFYARHFTVSVGSIALLYPRSVAVSASFVAFVYAKFLAFSAGSITSFHPGDFIFSANPSFA
ncbi:hypothetical protein EST38_g11665 [Candolleomyces aberdarensis]|uniref:Uncharacterized protein n=1 Tax=Candolleomyces aberdarensis TaxID=2316362 RepID=A0A4Q2D4A2_9AGAR|nr:hypothetical protein EST38_g11665 [Candolleomyces aberdarensis]